ncbi:hypothetical protein [Actinomadura sp. K4S16]|uniref:hypothetical protein n=1 Tax=Actinomadura sp. K4S16 TaxID=1316147 RepID=UPI0011EEFFF6|nr:hypothetical protein [Actinomadura sp. K4S16]
MTDTNPEAGIDPAAIVFPDLITACCDLPHPAAQDGSNFVCRNCDTPTGRRRYKALLECECESVVEIPDDGRSACPDCGLLYCIAADFPDGLIMAEPCDKPAVTEDGRHCLAHAPARDLHAALDNITDSLEDADHLTAYQRYLTRASQYPPLHTSSDSRYTAYAGHVTLQRHSDTAIRYWRCDHRHPDPQAAAECARQELLYQLGTADEAYGHAACSILGLHEWTVPRADGGSLPQWSWENVMMRA